MHMFPSSNNGNPFPYTTNNLFTSSFTLNQNPNSAPQNPPFFSHFHSPFPDGQQFLNPQNHHTNPINTTVFTTTAANNDPTPPLPKRQKRKKDRHSKILTAQGLRDRRMRLPHQMARKFFNLQDTLGFNRASETIEWLYANSKDAIEELIKNQMSESSMSDCEEASGGARKKGKSRKVHMDKARERARERTREKIMRKLGCSSNPNTMDQIEFPFEIGEDESSSSPSSHDSLHRQLENFLGTTSCSAFNYGKNAEFQGGVDSNNFMGYVGNLDVEDAKAIKNGVPIGGNYVQGQNPR